MAAKKSVLVLAVAPADEPLAHRLREQMQSAHSKNFVFCNHLTLNVAHAYDGIVFVGSDVPNVADGLAHVCTVAQDFDELRKPLGAVGGAVIMLGRAGLAVGKQVSSTAATSHLLRAFGAICSTSAVVVSGWVVTGASLAQISQIGDIVCEMVLRESKPQSDVSHNIRNAYSEGEDHENR
ncbi:DJ-1/PfpI family protein [Paraburkholderia strydomiana]|uniref:DJ-1/PfpI family protein n=1 Tax=Paraburkholderia strydomiana TaxID=1245417 RepID=UPI0038BA2D0B